MGRQPWAFQDKLPQRLLWRPVLTCVADAACSLCCCQMLMSVWSRMCAVGRIACASTWEEATSALIRLVLPTTNGIPSQGMSCLLFTDMLLKILLSLCPWPTNPVCIVMFNSQEITNLRGHGVTVCSFFNEWARRELIPQPPLRPKPSLWAAQVSRSSLPSV